jgi:16S rRNA (adenine1518-N6/adenine1519-N6)-dimethyltransferase
MSLQNKKSLGQHWLRDRATLTAIAKLAYSGTTPEHAAGTPTAPPPLALEIGPGLGTLTSTLFQYFDRVTAIEYDASLAAKLPAQFPGKSLTVIPANFLDFDLAQIPQPYVAVGNIPYYITSPILRKLLTTDHHPERIVLLIQREVAQRLATGPGDHTILSLATQSYASVALGPVVGRALFTPPPKVDSQVVILTPHPQPLATEADLRFIKQPFRNPRKKLTTTLPLTTGIAKDRVRAVLEQLQLSPDARPQDLSLANWLDLRSALSRLS